VFEPNILRDEKELLKDDGAEVEEDLRRRTGKGQKGKKDGEREERRTPRYPFALMYCL
jgi:hypothetical protein